MAIIIGMYDPQQNAPTPPLRDPARQPGAKAAERATKRHKWEGMSPAQMCRSMDTKELSRNARRGGVAAMAEQEIRRSYEAEALRLYKGEDA